MNRFISFISNITNTKLMIIGGITILTLIPLTIILSPVIKEIITIIKHLIKIGNENNKK